ncbi:hypothetical protein I79_017581 [Cricetulus griseus]|uniref:Uncharacterized protein n=1 Tax=Cricetulus griseus TaxID=10029 RepID=G3I2H5_CRIGR|nr:hypothetical protein I79_017581 [Cricetulus griseus]
MVASAQGTCLETFEEEKQVVGWRVSTYKEEAVASPQRGTIPTQLVLKASLRFLLRMWLWNNFANCKVQCTKCAN